MDLKDIQLLAKAYQFGSIKHQNQKRKNGPPYINHPIEVCRILTDCDISDVRILCAAILHDTIEDTDTTEEEIENQFGPLVKQYVLQCSDDKSLDKVQRKINQIEHSLHISEEARYIKIADKISNNAGIIKQFPKGWTPERCFGYLLWSQAVFKSLQGSNLKLNNKMKAVFEEGGVYKISEQQKAKLLQQYYASLYESKQA